MSSGSCIRCCRTRQRSSLQVGRERRYGIKAGARKATLNLGEIVLMYLRFHNLHTSVRPLRLTVIGLSIFVELLSRFPSSPVGPQLISYPLNETVLHYSGTGATR